MSVFSLFLNQYVSVYPDAAADDPSMSALLSSYIQGKKYNVLYTFPKGEQIELDTSGTKTFVFPSFTANTDWLFILARVIGDASIDYTGKDNDGSTTITGKLPLYGTNLLPGIGVLSLKNATATFVVTAYADDTVIELTAMVACEDDDARLVTNA